MTDREMQVFRNMPDALPLYEAVEKKILERFDGLEKKVGSSQVGYSTKYWFCALWPAIRRMKGWPDVYVVLSFGLDERIESPRIAQVARPRPNRWTHHLVVGRPEEVDDEVMGWLQRAYEFSMR